MSVNTQTSSPPICFARGTLIQTATGSVPVEDLQIKDCMSFYVEPIRANPLGPGQPFQDLSRVLFPRQLSTETLQHFNALEEVGVERNRAIGAASESSLSECADFQRKRKLLNGNRLQQFPAACHLSARRLTTNPTEKDHKSLM